MCYDAGMSERTEASEAQEIAKLRRDLLEAQANVEIERLDLAHTKDELRKMRDRAEEAEGLVKRQAQELHALRVQIAQFDGALTKIFERANIECVACAESCFTGGAWSEHKCELAQTIGEVISQ